jgi:hypothetical protein
MKKTHKVSIRKNNNILDIFVREMIPIYRRSILNAYIPFVVKCKSFNIEVCLGMWYSNHSGLEVNVKNHNLG